MNTIRKTSVYKLVCLSAWHDESFAIFRVYLMDPCLLDCVSQLCVARTLFFFAMTDFNFTQQFSIWFKLGDIPGHGYKTSKDVLLNQDLTILDEKSKSALLAWTEETSHVWSPSNLSTWLFLLSKKDASHTFHSLRWPPTAWQMGVFRAVLRVDLSANLFIGERQTNFLQFRYWTIKVSSENITESTYQPSSSCSVCRKLFCLRDF